MDPNQKNANALNLPPEPSPNAPKFYVQGEVGRTGAFPLTMPIRVLQALVNAGGFKDGANRTQITIRHLGGDAENFNYQDVVSGKNTEQNILLKPGDIIIVSPQTPGKPLAELSTPRAGAPAQSVIPGKVRVSVPLAESKDHPVNIFVRITTASGLMVSNFELTIEGQGPYLRRLPTCAR